MDKLRAMQAFIRIADEGSLTAAARSLSSSLPAMVRYLAALEAHLGARLFNRTTRRIALTEEGQRYLARCRQLLADLEDAEASINPKDDAPRGQLVVAAPVLFGQLYVAPVVTRFAQHHKEVRCKLLLHDRTIHLLEDKVDVGVHIGPLEDSSVVAQTVFSIRRLVVASPDFLSRHGVPAHPRDLLGSNCILFSSTHESGWTFHEKGKELSVPVSGKLEFNNATPAVQACVAGAGFGLFISYQVAEEVRQKKLVVVLQSFEPPKRPVSLIYPHARLLPARSRVFLEWLRRDLLALSHAAPGIGPSP